MFFQEFLVVVQQSGDRIFRENVEADLRLHEGKFFGDRFLKTKEMRLRSFEDFSDLILSIFLLTMFQDAIAQLTDRFHLISDRRIANIGVLLLRGEIRFVVHQRRRTGRVRIETKSRIVQRTFLFESRFEKTKDSE